MDLTGRKFGKLTVLKRNDSKAAASHHGGSWLCRCDCGNMRIVYANRLVNGNLKSCGDCSRVRDLTGQRYGRLVVLARANDKISPSGYKQRRWLCRCDCGKTTVVYGSSLRGGTVRSCGCLAREVQAGQSRKTTKYCIICGKPFTKITSLAKYSVTCSPACQALRIKAMRIGTTASDETREKLSESHKNEKIYAHLDEIRDASAEAIKKDPRYGKFETNIHAIQWHLVSPSGEDFRFGNLEHWLRTTGYTYFGVESESKDMDRVRSGLRNAKRRTIKLGRQRYYQGWAVIPVPDENHPPE
jgi:hypothetical protein